MAALSSPSGGLFSVAATSLPTQTLPTATEEGRHFSSAAKHAASMAVLSPLQTSEVFYGFTFPKAALAILATSASITVVSRPTKLIALTAVAASGRISRLAASMAAIPTHL